MHLRRVLWNMLLAIVATTACSQQPAVDADGGYVELKILAINDFHGRLEPWHAPGEAESGGAAYLAAHFRRAAASAAHTTIVSAGDLIGATPLISSLYHDEPTIEIANLWGLDFAAVGNHEFDQGADELLRLQRGGAHPDDGDSPTGAFRGAEFQFLAANVIIDASGETLLPAYAVAHYDGIPVAFIGLTLKGTPGLVTSSGITGLSFRDEAETINALVPEIRAAGIEAIVVLIHEGGYPAASENEDGADDDCRSFRGPIIDIVAKTDSAVDLFVTGHTHQRYLCRLNGRPVTSTGVGGRHFTDIDARLDRSSGDMTIVAFENVPVTHDVEPAADVETVVAQYGALAEWAADAVVGEITDDFTRHRNEAGESLLGALVADAQLHATRSSDAGGAQVTFMNHGGLRNDLVYSSPGRDDGEITFSDLFAVHPFGNTLVTLTLTGAQIHELLEQQWAGRTTRNILLPSRGFSYEWSESGANGARVDPATIRLNGESLRPTGRYRVTVNSFLAGGGDGFPLLREGEDRTEGIADVDALQDYFRAFSPLSPAAPNRIRVIP